MKTLKYICAVALVSLLGSCADLLETESKSSFDEATVFSNYDLAEQSNVGIFQALLSKSNYRGRFHVYFGMNTDIEWGNEWNNKDDKPNNDTRHAIYGYNLLATNTEMNTSGDNGPYATQYTALERANLCIRNLRMYGNVANDADMAYLLGEALVFRATIYYDLVRTWGDVPLRVDPIGKDDIYIAKTNRDVIYKQLLADLEEAWNYLPWPGQGHAMTVDRANKAYAKGLYARLALMASGYAQRPDDDKIGTGDPGTVRLSNDPELSKDVLYPKALAACVDVINNSGCQLYGSFEQLWRDLNNFKLSSATTGKEVLWVFPYGNNRGRWNYTYAIRHAGHDQYLGATATGSRGGNSGPVPTLWFDYEKEDTRRDVSCANYRWGVADAAGIAKPELSGLDVWYFGKYRYEWMETHPYNGGNDDGFKPAYMRYSDILLMAAECAIHSSCANVEGGGLAAAKNYLLPVRERAFAGNTDKAQAYVNSISSADAMFDAIVDERALEFVGEMLRKTDLIRWNLLKEKMDETKAKLNDLKNLTGEYAYLADNAYAYYKLNGTNVSLYGFKPGESAAPDASWTPYTDSAGELSKYFTTEEFSDKEINRMYDLDPNTRQYWPIFQQIVDNSQGMIRNDYGY